MQAWLRLERWFGGFVCFLILASVAYVVKHNQISPPISGLNQPIQVRQVRGFVQAVYVVEGSYLEVASNLHQELQSNSFSVSRMYGIGAYRRNGMEFVRLIPGDARQSTSYLGPAIFAEPRTTVIYSVRRSPWPSLWRRVQRDWATRNQKRNSPIVRASPVAPASI